MCDGGATHHVRRPVMLRWCFQDLVPGAWYLVCHCLLGVLYGGKAVGTERCTMAVLRYDSKLLEEEDDAAFD